MQILTEPKNALVKQYQRLFEMENVELDLPRGRAEGDRAQGHRAQDRRARPALDHGSILLDTMFELPSLEGVQEVVISEEVVTGNARPLYIYSEKAVEKEARRLNEGPLCGV